MGRRGIPYVPGPDGCILICMLIRANEQNTITLDHYQERQ
jgi:hypothetical protein